jgi:hypothetical protein
MISSAYPTLAEQAFSGRTMALRNGILAVAGSLALWLSAKLQVPFYPVPMTMQTFVVLVIGTSFGWRLGAATVALNLIEGAGASAGTPEKASVSPIWLARPAATCSATCPPRAPIRREDLRPAYVCIGDIAELQAIKLVADEIRIGACVTHACLVSALAGFEECDGVVAAGGAALNGRDDNTSLAAETEEAYLDGRHPAHLMPSIRITSAKLDENGRRSACP